LRTVVSLCAMVSVVQSEKSSFSAYWANS